MSGINCGASLPRGINRMPPCISKLFIEFVKPCNVLHQFHHILSKQEEETVVVETRNNGDTAGSQQLVKLLSERSNWFALILEILRNRDVKLQHIANLMEEEMRIYESLSSQGRSGNNMFKRSPATPASLYIKYNILLEKKIHQIFISCITPEKVLYVFLKYSKNVLIKIDRENVESKFNQNGSQEAARILLERLVLYDDWFEVLQEVLKDREVKLVHVANQIVEATRSTRDEYEKEKVKLQTTYTDGAQVMGQVKIRPLLRASASNEFETDSPEMKSGADVLSQSRGTVESDGRSQAQAGDSVAVVVRNSGKTRLMSEAESGNKENLESLIRQTSDLDACDKDGRTALMCAANKGQVECVDILIRRGCDVDKIDVKGKTALIMAAMSGSDECMRLLIDAGASVDVVTAGGSTALMAAAVGGSGKGLSLLLNSPCDPDKRHNVDGRTALMYAVSRGHLDCIKILIEGHCDVDAADKKGVTALIYAVQSGYSRCVEFLIDGGADVDKPDKHGISAVMWAIACEYVECLEVLIKKKANVNIANLSGLTPLEAAKAKGCQKIIRLIKKAAVSVADR